MHPAAKHNSLKRLAVAAMAIALGCQPAAEAPINETVAATQPVTSVAVARVRSHSFTEGVSLPMTIEPAATAELMPASPGFVRAVLVRLGDQVEQGQLLLKIESAAIADRLAGKAESVRRHEAALEASRAERVAADSRLDARRASSELQAQEADTVEKLVEQGVYTEQHLEEARAREKAARAELAAAEDELAAAASRIDLAEAALAEARAQLDAAQAAAERLRLVAPVAGVVTSVNVTPGEYVPAAGQADAGPLVVLADVSKLVAVVRLTSEAAGKAPVGAAVELTLDGSGDHVVRSVISRVAGVLDPTTGLMRAEIDLSPTSHPLLRAGAGGLALVGVRRERRPSAPLSAVVHGAAGDYVIKVAPGGRLERIKVEVVGQADGRVGLLGGVREGDRVVAEHADELQNVAKIEGNLREVGA